MSWTTAVADLRTLLSDGATDKYRFRKKCFGTVDGTNAAFKTFEFRRLTNFTTAASPLGVYVSGVLVSTASDDPSTGEFVLTTPPSSVANNKVEATYYSQWFLDAELAVFLENAAQFCSLTQADDTPAGLRPAALKYAAGEAYQKLALRFAEHLSEWYRLEDAPDKDQLALADQYRKIADDMMKQGRDLRDDFYSRQGQQLSPRFLSVPGVIREPMPPR